MSFMLGPTSTLNESSRPQTFRVITNLNFIGEDTGHFSSVLGLYFDYIVKAIRRILVLLHDCLWAVKFPSYPT